MSRVWNLPPACIAVVALSALAGACQQDTTAPSNPQSAAVTTAQTTDVVAAARSTNGAAGQTPAFYDGNLFTVNMKQQPDNAAASLISKNGNINEIYASNDLDDEQDFVPVINAIQGEGFNPLWRQNLIVFNSGFTPHQFTSEEDVLAAAAGAHPEITIVTTDEMYRCAVVGHK